MFIVNHLIKTSDELVHPSQLHKTSPMKDPNFIYNIIKRVRIIIIFLLNIFLVHIILWPFKSSLLKKIIQFYFLFLIWWEFLWRTKNINFSQIFSKYGLKINNFFWNKKLRFFIETKALLCSFFIIKISLFFTRSLIFNTKIWHLKCLRQYCISYWGNKLYFRDNL